MTPEEKPAPSALMPEPAPGMEIAPKVVEQPKPDKKPEENGSGGHDSGLLRKRGDWDVF